MAQKKQLSFDTKLIHAGVQADPSTGSVMTPIYQTSTYKQTSPGNHKGFEYSRSSNPTRKAAEENLAAIEGGKFAFCFSSGVAALDALLRTLDPGDEVISTNDLYGGSYRLFTSLFSKYGIKFHFISFHDTALLKQKINDKTKLIWLETPSNPMMSIVDIKAVSSIAKEYKICLAVDNTFATPYLQRPLELGADIVMHSLTKYIGGHSDLVMGALICNDEKYAEQLKFIQKSSGAVPGPMDCFLLLRGVKTLHLRMQRHCDNGAKVAEYLKEHPKVDRVNWPGFKDHPQHEVAKRQMKDFGGMISFNLKSQSKDDAFQLMSYFKLFTLAESLGGVESLCCHPVTMTHASVPKEDREALGVVNSLIRLSVGIEDVGDLIDDLDQALSQI